MILRLAIPNDLPRLVSEQAAAAAVEQTPNTSLADRARIASDIADAVIELLLDPTITVH